MVLLRYLQHALLFGLLMILALSGLSGPALAATPAGSPAARHISQMLSMKLI